jgi:hypothetical protein
MMHDSMHSPYRIMLPLARTAGLAFEDLDTHSKVAHSIYSFLRTSAKDFFYISQP